MERTLVDRNTKKTWFLKLQGTLVNISLNGGKAREKKLKSDAEALLYAQKEMWKQIKKGYVYHNSDAQKLAPALHIYIGRGYTGFMPMAPIGGTNSFYLAYVLGEFDQENIYKIDEDGSLKLIVELPPPSLTFDMKYVERSNRIYINANHDILLINPDNGDLSRLSSEKDQFISVFSIAASRIAWIDGLMLRVTDKATDLVIWQKRLDVEAHEVHSYEICAALSKDGKQLAYYSTYTKNITLINLDTEKQTNIEKDSDSITRKIYFSADGNTIFTQEAEDSWQIKYYHLNKKDGWCRLSDSGEDTVLESAIDSKHNRIAVATRGHVKVYDMQTKDELFRFEPENAIKYCNIAFLKDYMAVYTDHGCASLYKI